MKQRRLLTAVALLIVLVGCGVVARRMSLPASVIITPEQINSVSGGMTAAEVEAIFGVPPGDYAKETTVQYTKIFPNEDARLWITDGISAVVVFDDQGKVLLAAELTPYPRVRPWHVRILEWFGL